MPLVRWFCCVWLASVAALPAQTWLHLESPDFTLLSDASQRDVERFALDYAAYRQTVREFFAPPGGRTPRMLILLFRHERDFARHTPPPQRADSKLIVFSTEIDAAAVLALPLGGNRRQALVNAFEFDTMWSLRRYGYFVPTWMSQGAGEVLANLQLRRDQRVIGSPDERFTSVLDQPLYRWDRFFGIGIGSSEYSGDKATGMFHAQAWGLMHWILIDPEGPARFRQLAERLREQDPRHAIEAVTGIDNLDRSGNRQVRARRSPLMLPFDAEATKAGWQFRPAEPVEVQVYLADLLAASGRAAEADWAVEQALQRAPGRPVVLEAAARRELRQRRLDLAVTHYRAAIQAGSTNPVAYLLSANQRLDDSRTNGRDVAGGGVVPAVRAALEEIRRAIELDPGNPEAFRLFGRACFVAREVPADAREQLARGIGAGERGAFARYYRGLLSARLGDLNTARLDFAALRGDGDIAQPLRDDAARQLLVIRFRELQGEIDPLVAAGHWEQAEQRLANAEAEFASSAFETEFRQLERQVENAQRAARRSAIQPTVDQVNALVRRHQYGEALKIATASLESASDPEERAFWARTTVTLEEAEAADRVRVARHDERWAEAVLLAERFLTKYPSGKYSEEIRRYQAEAEQHVTGASSGSPAL